MARERSCSITVSDPRVASKYCRGDVGFLTRVGSTTIGYFSPPSEPVLLWFWQ